MLTTKLSIKVIFKKASRPMLASLEFQGPLTFKKFEIDTPSWKLSTKTLSDTKGKYGLGNSIWGLRRRKRGVG